SDADVLLHAVCDAILGALGKGDIGEHFPNTDDHYKDISSLKLLQKVQNIMTEDGYAVGNVDAVVIAEEPNIKKYKPQMKTQIASMLKIDSSAVNIKATTQEGLGSLGNKEGIAAYATVLLFKSGENE
ncbi:MAG: 2-C-methyl-D-erythritol 2,4-cyclodiphosphate synthase, partial [Candidatus Omnitrophica bacterium]|nr:2-C-methyl-D-erythritol 2,4-cyclodiphosphate synthase [Candidatus Omnitrophota bacterium]